MGRVNPGAIEGHVTADGVRYAWGGVQAIPARVRTPLVLGTRSVPPGGAAVWVE